MTNTVKPEEYEKSREIYLQSVWNKTGERIAGGKVRSECGVQMKVAIEGAVRV